MRILSLLFILFFLILPLQAQENITQRFQSMIEKDWITEVQTFTKTSPSFFAEENFEDYYLGELQISGYNIPFAWDSDLTILNYISTKLGNFRIYSGVEADPNYLGDEIKWEKELSTLLWFKNVTYQSNLNSWYLIGQSDCLGIRKFPNVRFEQVFKVENPRLNFETGLFILPYDSTITSISKTKTTLKTVDGSTISGDGYDFNADSINDAFIYYETVNQSSDLPSTYKRLMVNVGGEWRLKWQHLDEDCI